MRLPRLPAASDEVQAPVGRRAGAQRRQDRSGGRRRDCAGEGGAFTAQEQENIRRALRFLRIRSGGWGPLAKALRLTASTINHMAGREKVSARLALRLAWFAGVSVEDMMAGKYPPEGTCPHCGHAGTG